MTIKDLGLYIAELASADAGGGEFAVRVAAVLYAGQCLRVEELLEHCAALARSGRAGNALEFAADTRVSEDAKALGASEFMLWRARCAASGLLLPPELDADALAMAESLFAHPIQDSHPLFRDYRRAMRLHEPEKALLSLAAIARTNSADAKIVAEYSRLENAVAARLRGRLAELLAADKPDIAEVGRICEFLQMRGDGVEDSPEFTAARKLLEESGADAESAVARLRAIGEISEDTLDEAAALLGNLAFGGGMARLSEGDAAFVGGVLDGVETLWRERLGREKSRRAAVEVARKLGEVAAENPRGKRLSEAVAELKKLRAKTRGVLAESTAKILNAEISKLGRRLLRRRVWRGFAGCAALACAGVAAYFAFDFAESALDDKGFNNALNELALVDNPEFACETAEKIAARYAVQLADTANNARFMRLREKAQADFAAVKRLRGLLDFAETLDFEKASTLECARASEAVATVADELFTLPLAVQPQIKARLDRVAPAVSEKIEARKMARSQKLRVLLAEYEAILGEYEAFGGSPEELDKREKVLVGRLRGFFEEPVKMFRAHQIDVDNFNSISSSISDARSRYMGFDSQRRSLLASKSFAEYSAAAKLLRSNAFVPADFYKKLSKICAQEAKMKLGQSLLFCAEPTAVEFAGRAGDFSRADLKLPRLLSDVYVYTREGGGVVHSLGAAVERENRWPAGMETMQRIDGIFENGKVSGMLFRRHEIFGQKPTGEKLTGGALADESLFAREVARVAARESLLAALEFSESGKCSAVFKMLLQKCIFEAMRADPVYSGLLYSKSALEREAAVAKYSRGVRSGAWIFDNAAREDLISREVYAKPLADLKREARVCLNALADIEKNPLKMVGVVSESGAKIVFAPSNGAVWAVDKNGVFRKMADSVESLAGAAELSPIFAETKSTKAILMDAQAKADK